MASKLKVLTVVGTRPEVIRLSEVIRALDSAFDHILVHTGQNYDFELNQVFFDQLAIRKPDHFLEAAGGTPSETVARVIERVDKVLETEKPDAFLVLGDTNSCMAAYAAKRRKIPIFHMEAGNRCFDGRVPEEMNRKVIDHLADMNLVYSDRARDNLLREGLAPDRIIKTGSPMYEVLTKNEAAIDASKVLETLGLTSGGYFVASIHREENVDSQNLDSILDAFARLSETYGKPIVLSAHPRTRARLEERGGVPEYLKIMKPFGLFEYVKLEKEAFCTLSDSGTISEESSILNFPAVNVRESHERPEAMDEAAVIMSGVSTDRILEAVALATKSQPHGSPRAFAIPADYAMPNVSQKVVRIIASYTDYVARVSRS